MRLVSTRRNCCRRGTLTSPHALLLLSLFDLYTFSFVTFHHVLLSTKSSSQTYRIYELSFWDPFHPTRLPPPVLIRGEMSSGIVTWYAVLGWYPWEACPFVRGKGGVGKGRGRKGLGGERGNCSRVVIYEKRIKAKKKKKRKPLHKILSFKYFVRVTGDRLGHVMAQTLKEGYRDRCSHNNRYSQWERFTIVNVIYDADKLQTGGYFRIIFIWKEIMETRRAGLNNHWEVAWAACHVVRVELRRKHDEENLFPIQREQSRIFQSASPEHMDRKRQAQEGPVGSESKRSAVRLRPVTFPLSLGDFLLLLESFPRLRRSW